ncbi:MAG TPA: YdeI/OmpD-associated family protein [Galbitalea sp.]|jgi:hypothetical protein
MPIEFSSILTQADGMSATGIPVPDAVVTELAAGKNPPVTVQARKAGSDADWYTYRISIATRNGEYIMSFSSANRTASGFVAGDPLEVRVSLDTAPRTIELPEDLKTALTTSGGLDRFLALSYSKQRGYVEPVEAAKGVDTRQRRVEKIAGEFSA